MKNLIVKMQQKNKNLKLYVPIVQCHVTQSKGRVMSKMTTTLISVEKCCTIKAQMPSRAMIEEHLRAQLLPELQHQPYTTMKVMVPSWIYQDMCKELTHRSGRSYTEQVIDIVMESNQVPIIQFLVDTDARRKRKE